MEAKVNSHSNSYKRYKQGAVWPQTDEELEEAEAETLDLRPEG